MKILTDDEVLDRAGKWARFHRKPETRNRMDECLEGISKADQRRVYLCGQRIAAGIAPKVLPAPASNKETSNGKTKPKAKQAAKRRGSK